MVCLFNGMGIGLARRKKGMTGAGALCGEGLHTEAEHLDGWSGF